MENLKSWQGQNFKIESLKEDARRKLGRIFDEREELEGKIDDLVFKLELYQSHGLSFDKGTIIRGLQESIDIKDKDTFIKHLLNVLGPIMTLKLEEPEVFESVEREAQLRESGYIKLSEVLRLELEGNEARLHLVAATELIKGAGIGTFKREIEDGLLELSEIVKNNGDIEQIVATSWITAKNPRLLEKLGFTIVGEISNEERAHYEDEERPIARAIMTRKDFLVRYGNK